MTITLSPSQQNFLRKRRILVSAWRSIGPVLVAGLLIFAGMLFLTAPMLLNPFAVMDRLQENSVDITTLQTMAIMLPVATLLVCLLFLFLIGLMYAACSKEKMYLELLDQIQREK